MKLQTILLVAAAALLLPTTGSSATSGSGCNNQEPQYRACGGKCASATGSNCYIWTWVECCIGDTIVETCYWKTEPGGSTCSNTTWADNRENESVAASVSATCEPSSQTEFRTEADSFVGLLAAPR